MRFAYADPPYVGQAVRLYSNEAKADGRRAAEVNHPLLVRYLVDEFPDGWALSCSSPSLGYVLDLCPPDVRVGAWVKPFAVYKPGVNPGYCWEPVVWHGGRKLGRDVDTVRDYLSEPVRLRPDGDGAQVPGAKPWRFCWWVFDLLGVEHGDELVDVRRCSSRTTMERSKPLRRDGPGARRFAAQRSTLARKPPKSRGRATSTGPTSSERAAVAERSGGWCEVRGPRCDGRATDVHHRNRDRGDNRMRNLVHCCSWCHLRWVHGEPTRSLEVGWLVSRYADDVPPLPPPETIP